MCFFEFDKLKTKLGHNIVQVFLLLIVVLALQFVPKTCQSINVLPKQTSVLSSSSSSQLQKLDSSKAQKLNEQQQVQISSLSSSNVSFNSSKQFINSSEISESKVKDLNLIATTKSNKNYKLSSKHLNSKQVKLYKRYSQGKFAFCRQTFI